MKRRSLGHILHFYYYQQKTKTELIPPACVARSLHSLLLLDHCCQKAYQQAPTCSSITNNKHVVLVPNVVAWCVQKLTGTPNVY